jgi:hypothetical protein
MSEIVFTVSTARQRIGAIRATLNDVLGMSESDPTLAKLVEGCQSVVSRLGSVLRELDADSNLPRVVEDRLDTVSTLLRREFREPWTRSGAIERVTKSQDALETAMATLEAHGLASSESMAGGTTRKEIVTRGRNYEDEALGGAHQGSSESAWYERGTPPSKVVTVARRVEKYAEHLRRSIPARRTDLIEQLDSIHRRLQILGKSWVGLGQDNPVFDQVCPLLELVADQLVSVPEHDPKGLKVARDRIVEATAMVKGAKRQLSPVQDIQAPTPGELVRRLEAVEQRIKGPEKWLTDSIKDLSTIQKDLVDKWEDEIRSIKERGVAQFDEAQAKFGEAQQRLADAVALALDSSAEVARSGGDLQKRSAEILEGLVIRKDEAERLLQVIGDKGLSAGYAGAATQARAEAVYWQRFTVFAFLLLVLVLAGLFIPYADSNHSFTWDALLVRVVLSVTLGFLAGYTSRLGDRYLSIEQRNRKLELDLAALGPYLAHIQTDKREEFRLEVGRRLFAKDDAAVPAEKSVPNAVDVLNSKTAEKLVDLAGKALDKKVT